MPLKISILRLQFMSSSFQKRSTVFQVFLKYYIINEGSIKEQTSFGPYACSGTHHSSKAQSHQRLPPGDQLRQTRLPVSLTSSYPFIRRTADALAAWMILSPNV